MLGLVLSATLVARSQVFGDQLNLLSRGWLLAARGELVPYGNPLSTGGNEPGALTSLLVGLPLELWRDHRAPTVVIWLFHLAAWLLLDRVVRETLGWRERVLFAVVYWLNPWRLHFSGFLWNPNYLFVLGALHLWTAWCQAERPRFWASLLQALAIGLAFQIHAAFVLLAAASALLWWRGWQKLHWGGVVAGAALAAASLAPWIAEALRHPAILSAHAGFPGRGLVMLFPLLRGLLYWLRYGSLSLSDQLLRFDFTTAFGAAADRWLATPLLALAQIAGGLTLLVSLAANWELLRSRGRAWLTTRGPGASGREWIAGYAAISLGAAFVVYCLAPTTIMFWQGVPLFHAATIPPVLWLARQLDGPRAAWVRRGVAATALFSVLIGLAMAFGSPTFRCGGRRDEHFPLRSNSPMFTDLGIQQTCPWPLDVPGEWWPDVLPEEGRKSDGHSTSPAPGTPGRPIGGRLR